MSFLRNAGSLAATTLVSIPIGLLTSVILARYLGPQDMGFYSVLQRFSTIAFVFCLLGSQSASIYRLRGARTEAAVVATTSLFIVLSSSLLATLVLFLLGGRISNAALGGTPMLAYYLAVITIPAQTVGRMMMSFARGLDRFALSNGYLLAIGIGTCVALTIGFGVYDVGLIGALAIVAGVHFASTMAVCTRVLSITGLTLRTSVHELVETTRYGLKSQAQAILTQVHENVDVLILAALLDAPEQVAFYAIATGVVNRIKILPSAISNAFLPHVAGLPPHQAAVLAARASRHSFAWVCLLAISAALAAPLVVPWAYGRDFVSVVHPILILLPATIFLSTNGLLARYFMAINRQGVVVRTQSCSATLNIGLNFLLIPIMGIAGAAIASLVSYAAELLLITTAFRRASNLPLRQVFILDRNDCREYLQRAKALRRRWAAARTS
jgi:O-antigen/teichoic acid export membrane protein